jgi:hypothetical protein
MYRAASLRTRPTLMATMPSAKHDPKTVAVSMICASVWRGNAVDSSAILTPKRFGDGERPVN